MVTFRRFALSLVIWLDLFWMCSPVFGQTSLEGYDALHVVNHPRQPVGEPGRHGSDALVLNGVIYDCYRGIGDLDDSRQQALNVGNYALGRLRE